MALPKPIKKLSPILKDKETPLDRSLRLKKKQFEQNRIKNNYRGK